MQREMCRNKLRGFIVAISTVGDALRNHSSTSVVDKGTHKLNEQQLDWIETYRLDRFPQGKVALHFHCDESNMFATNCACHIKCIEPTCKEAYGVCQKYRDSQGCKYVLLRGGSRNKIATLKRVPTADEIERFRIDQYPTSMDSAVDMYGKWYQSYKAHNQNSLLQSTGAVSRPQMSDLVKRAGSVGQQTLDAVLGSVKKSVICNSNRTTSAAASTVAGRKYFMENGIALVSLNYRTPMTLLNTIRTWNSSGLLTMARERLMILNDPLPSEVAMSLEHGFQILQPKDITNGKLTKPNVLTIGAAFYYALKHVKSEYMLFLENDFKMDASLTQEEIISELVGAAGMLHQGTEIVRMLSRKTKGCGTFKDCNHAHIHLDDPDPMKRVRNWYSFYCRDKMPAPDKSSVDDCLPSDAPVAFRCFTSWDSNWTLNGVMVKKSTMLSKKYPTEPTKMSIADIGLKSFAKQDAFESTMIHEHSWMSWKVPICISYKGLFIHEEIETSQ